VALASLQGHCRREKDMIRIISEDGLRCIYFNTSRCEIDIREEREEYGKATGAYEINVDLNQVYADEDFQSVAKVFDRINKEIYDHVMCNCTATTIDVTKIVLEVKTELDKELFVQVEKQWAEQTKNRNDNEYNELLSETLEHLGEVDA